MHLRYLRVSLGLSLAASQQVPDVHTSSGILQGTAPLPNVHAYLGIPYAAPPVGELRFAPPQPYGSSNGTVRACYESSPGCFQKTFLTAFSDRGTGTAESEDMLSINIWTPAKSTATKLPVLIFLYGGGFTQGANALDEYSGLRIVAEQNNFILASIKCAPTLKSHAPFIDASQATVSTSSGFRTRPRCQPRTSVCSTNARASNGCRPISARSAGTAAA